MKTFYHVRSFTKNGAGGNFAGVVTDAQDLTETDMKRIAKQAGYSETAFVLASSVADHKIRFFTPNEEVDLCGHATIATFSMLRNLGMAQGTLTQETKAGILQVRIEDDAVFMEQNVPTFGKTLSVDQLRACFENTNGIDQDLPVMIVDTGLPDIILPIRNLEQLNALQMNRDAVIELSRAYQCVGIHAFTTETIGEASAHCRNFAPLFGIDEEPATGTSNGALAAYLFSQNVDISATYRFEQGYIMDSPSEILGQIEQENNKITGVWVGGSAVCVGSELL